MQIGEPRLDAVCERAIVPALKACGFDPKRVDKHNQGGLLKSEIIGFIERSGIIVADLTNERPNCYLEIGYAMGIGKFKNLILTAREDHSHDSPNHARGGPKVHFDLAGYDVLFWHADRLHVFRSELEKRISRRMAVLTPAMSGPVAPWDAEWNAAQREAAKRGLEALGKTAFMEARFALDAPKTSKTQQELDDAARDAPIHTFGWPIAAYLGNRNEFRPRPRVDGIVAEISVEDRSSYDYWALRRNGDFYFLGSLFEDGRDPTRIFFNTRIVRVTETLLYCARLYSRLGVDPTAVVNVAVGHGGLRGRFIGSSNPARMLHDRQPSAVEATESEVRSSLQAIESDLVSLVKQLLDPLFVLFDFFQVSDSVYEDIVNNFVQGRCL